MRGVFNSTTEHSDELVGYLLVGVSFLSLALCQSSGAFHRVEMVQMRLGPRGKAVSALVFDLLSFGYIALTDWYFLQFVMSSYRREAMASTPLATPLWIPETAMVVGAAMLLIVLGKAIVDDVRKLAVVSAGLEVARRPGHLPRPAGRGDGHSLRHRRAGDRLSAAAWRRAGAAEASG